MTKILNKPDGTGWYSFEGQAVVPYRFLPDAIKFSQSPTLEYTRRIKKGNLLGFGYEGVINSCFVWLDLEHAVWMVTLLMGQYPAKIPLSCFKGNWQKIQEPSFNPEPK